MKKHRRFLPLIVGVLRIEIKIIRQR